MIRKRPKPLIYQTIEQAVAAMPRLPLPQALIDHKAKVAEYEAGQQARERQRAAERAIHKAEVKRAQRQRYKAKAKAKALAALIKPMRDYGDI